MPSNEKAVHEMKTLSSTMQTSMIPLPQEGKEMQFITYAKTGNLQ